MCIHSKCLFILREEHRDFNQQKKRATPSSRIASSLIRWHSVRWLIVIRTVGHIAAGRILQSLVVGQQLGLGGYLQQRGGRVLQMCVDRHLDADAEIGTNDRGCLVNNEWYETNSFGFSNTSQRNKLNPPSYASHVISSVPQDIHFSVVEFSSLIF